MLTVVICGWVLKRPSDLINSLFAAALIILVWQPQQLFQAGFQLSFCVVLCIILGLTFLFASWFLLKEAEKRVADYDRTRHWRNEVVRRPRVKPKQVEEYEAAEHAKEF